MEKITEFVNMRKLIHRAYCDDCKVELIDTGVVLTSFPAQYPYKCPKCGKAYTFYQNYPWVEWLGDEIEYEAPMTDAPQQIPECKTDPQITITCDSDYISVGNSNNIDSLTASTTKVVYL